MPNLFSFANHANNDALQEMGPEDLPQKRPRRESLLRKPLSLLRRHHAEYNDVPPMPQAAPAELASISDNFITRRPSLPDIAATSKKAIPSLPRPQTFRRQNSEKRDRLMEVAPTAIERRTLSVDRRRYCGPGPTCRTLSPLSLSISAPNAPHSNDGDHLPTESQLSTETGDPKVIRNRANLPPLQIPTSVDDNLLIGDEGDDHDEDIDKTSLQEDHDRRWILNLSMHFRDKSNREKFFVTYAETPKCNSWRRITISLDYRNAPVDSLEADLSTLGYQREKSLRIYEAIRESLPEIQYYSTVTNLKLETTPEDGQLHVHVREDANEIIQFPQISLFDHINCLRFNESSLDFISHLSGFVYKVRIVDRVVIKKEIPGPDTVDEFLYEVNALDSLNGSKHVVRLEGLVTDNRGELVKGLLISYASQGSLVDMIYDLRGSSSMPWYRREKWARQIVSGLSDIHEAGFVQGDFTMSNIVIDENDEAQIIDINRRGCPVGWEPPELERLIDSGQRIGMCIGVKTDIYQLGMVLWALAEEVEEPERVERPLPPVYDGIPTYFRDIVRRCLSSRPQDRPSAQQLLLQFPGHAGQLQLSPRHSVDFQRSSQMSDQSVSTTTRHSERQYIDPEMAVTLEDVRGQRMPHLDHPTPGVSYVAPDSNPASTTYQFESSGSWIVAHRHRSRGRSPVSSRRRRSSPYGKTESSATSFSEESPARWRTGGGCSSDFGSDEREVKHNPSLDTLEPKPTTANMAETSLKVERTSAIDKRFAQVQTQDVIRETELQHTDSGFDEAMTEQIEFGEAHINERRIYPLAKPSTPTHNLDHTPSSSTYCTPAGTPAIKIDEGHKDP